MAQLRSEYTSFVERQAEVIAIGPEDAAAFKDYWDKHEMPFPGIADPQHVTANRYGQEVKVLRLGRMPALFVIDREGLIRFSHRGQSMSDIPANADVLALLDELKREGG